MRVEPNKIYHLHNIGNNGQLIFREKETYRIFLNLFNRFVSEYCEVICWGLVPKEFKFMIKVNERGAEMIKVGSITMSRFADAIRKMQSQFALQMNRKLGRKGSYFQCKCKADYVSDDMYGVLFDAIHNMPVHSSLVNDEHEWPFSSNADYYNGRAFDLCNFDLASKITGITRIDSQKEFQIHISKRTCKKVIGSLKGRDFNKEHHELHKLRYRNIMVA